MKKELEIYIHIPFCVQKCRYCDFLSAPADEKSQDEYMEALCKEITEKSRLYRDCQITTIFIGGGTPSSVKAEWIKKVMECLREYYCISEDAEITMEMNPGTVDRQSLEIYYKAGINRLSIGLQSANDVELKALGRIHSYEHFLEAYFTAREIGFLNINVDIMSGLPGQRLEDYRETLKKITGLKPAPEHISAYSLIIEEGTPFYREYEVGRLQLPDEDTEREMYEMTGVLLQENGYERYEISNYAQKGRECRHNVGYWRRVNYVGFGIGAASLVDNVRFRNAGKLQQYVLNPCEQVVDVEKLTLTEQMEETMFLGLRMTEGVSYDDFQKNFGMSLDWVYGEVINRYVQEGLLMVTEHAVGTDGESDLSEATEKNLALTLKGMDVSNYVMADFLEPSV